MSTSTSNTPSFKIILGSSSKARKDILKEMGYEFKIMTADIDEKGIRMEKPEELVMALAEAKANAIVSMLQNIDLQYQDDKCTTLLLTADTAEAIISRLQTAEGKVEDSELELLITADQVVVYDGVIREKPSSKEEAREFMKGYSGGHAATVGSVLVTNLKTGTRKGGWDKVEIYFDEIPDEVIDNLIEEGIVLNVAGGLIIEHPSILPIVKQVVGTTDSVMGLPKALTEKLIQEAL
ncbi:Maf-like protein [Thalictrum thalictroides]|uniref:Maf-like protein n=1 Tax=Thalictrum thalictroides TaxID=46969 RepID=A0A7J6X3Z3_THATH|nr:Maf-like protein [Thalictrum thalictroides]